jgi:hemerythrin-like domain-containing protein
MCANGATFEANPETDRGRAIYGLLLSVHRKIRRDLDRVERLAAEALDGLPAEEVRKQLDEIKRDGMLWQLQVSCLRYCHFVHMHHNAEDGDFFPELRETNPAVNPVVDRLEADHRRVSDHLDAVEAAANALADDEGVEARKAVVDTLQALAENLLAHLDLEELSVQPTVLRLREWTVTT